MAPWKSALKAHALWVGSPPSIPFFSSPRWQVALIEIETLLGLWLLIGKLARPAWAAALGFFSVLTGASLYLALQGERSCGCFGRLHANPWLTFALDLAAVTALLTSHPARTSEGRPTPWSQGFLMAAAGATVLVGLLIGGGLLLLAENPPEALARLRGDAITVEPPLSEIGKGVEGEKRTLTIRLKNHRDQPVRIIAGSANCSCVATDDLPLTIAPGESRSMTVRVMFRGSAGRFRQGFALYTDDVRQSTVAAWFAGRVTDGPAPVRGQETVGR